MIILGKDKAKLNNQKEKNIHTWSFFLNEISKQIKTSTVNLVPRILIFKFCWNTLSASNLTRIRSVRADSFSGKKLGYFWFSAFDFHKCDAEITKN